MRAGLTIAEQHRARRRQQRHPGAGARPRATTARWSSTTASRTSPQRRGGSGQYGNAINVFRADNVIVRGNRIGRAAFSAVRGNAASNLQIAGNTVDRHRRGRDLLRIRLRGRGDRQQHRRRRGARHFGDQLQRGRPARGGAGQPDPQSQDQASGRHRSERRGGRRHRGRGRRLGHRQRDRERADRRHQRRLGQVSCATSRWSATWCASRGFGITRFGRRTAPAPR